MKQLIFAALFSCCATSHAAGWSAAAVPTKIDFIPGGGFMIAGDFGNSGGCTTPNMLIIAKTHPEYKLLYSLALSALLGKHKVYGYVHECTPVLWYTVASTTYNYVTDNGSLAIVSQ